MNLSILRLRHTIACVTITSLRVSYDRLRALVQTVQQVLSDSERVGRLRIMGKYSALWGNTPSYGEILRLMGKYIDQHDQNRTVPFGVIVLMLALAYF